MNENEGSFVRIADWISEAIGTPANIGFWFFALSIWTIVFVVNPDLQNSNFLPTWFTSQAYNFPLNTVTTAVELFIGFFCAAATNRAEKHLRKMFTLMQETLDYIKITTERDIAETEALDQKLDKILEYQGILMRAEIQRQEQKAQANSQAPRRRLRV